MAFREYVDNSDKFQDYLRAVFYAHKRGSFDPCIRFTNLNTAGE